MERGCKKNTTLSVIITKFRGKSKASGTKDSIIKSLKHLNSGNTGESIDISLANHVSEGFLTPMKDFQPLTAQPTSPVPHSEFSLFVTSVEGFKALSAINPTKPQGPDGMPGWLLRENADLVANPICDILNTSYRDCRLPRAWKEADVIPVPKQKPIFFPINKHLRPILLTPPV